MRRMIVLALLALTSCSQAEIAKRPPRDVSNLPVYPIEEPFRVVEESTLYEPAPLVIEALLRVWEVDDGDGWISLDATAQQPLSEGQANAVFADLFSVARAEADSRALNSAYVDVCWLDSDAYEICGGAEYTNSAEAGWVRE